MAGSDIPFHRSSEARIQIRLTGCDEADLERGSRAAQFGHLAPGEKGIERGGIAMRPARHHGQALFGRNATGDGPPPSLVLDEGSVTHRTGKQAAKRWRKDGTEHRHPFFDECDVDSELSVATDELLGAVERVHQPEACSHLWNPARGNGFLGNDRNIRCQRSQCREDQRLGHLICRGHRRGVVLAADRKVGRVHRHDHIACGARHREDLFQHFTAREGSGHDRHAMLNKRGWLVGSL